MRPAVLDDERQSTARYLGAIRHHWPLIVYSVALGVTVAALYSFTTPKRYEAQADLLVTPVTDTSDVFVGMNVLRDSATAPLIVGRSLKTPEVTDGVAKRLGLHIARKKLLKKVDIAPIQQSSVVSIKAKDHDPELAAKLANTFPQVLIQQQTAQFRREMQGAIDRLRTQLRTERLSPGEAVALEDRLAQLQTFVGAPDPTLKLLSAAEVPTDAVWPRPVLSILVALFAGLILGLGAALLLELAEPRLADESELLARVPVLAWVPRARRGVVDQYLRGGGSLPAELWEAYRTLRASLAAHDVGERGVPKTVLVTSAIKAEGKTMTAANLAIAMAAGGHRVVLVDGDFRRSMVGTVFRATTPSKGFASLLYGDARPEEALVASPGYGDRLRLLLAGDERPIDMLEPRRIEQVLNELKREADVIIIDSPPVTEFADAVALADAVDVVLIAVRLGHSRRDRFNELVRFLSRHGIDPAGYVVTARQRFRVGVFPSREQRPIEEWSPADRAETPAKLVEPWL